MKRTYYVAAILSSVALAAIPPSSLRGAGGAAPEISSAPAQPGPASGAKTPETSVASKTVSGISPTSLYKSERLRNPFIQMGGGSYKMVGEPAPFNIHSLVLKGVMADASGDYAVLIQPDAGTTYILKKGKLLDSKNKPLPGVTGTVKLKQKTVHVMTSDKDVQTLILGEQQEGI